MGAGCDAVCAAPECEAEEEALLLPADENSKDAEFRSSFIVCSSVSIEIETKMILYSR